MASWYNKKCFDGAVDRFFEGGGSGVIASLLRQLLVVNLLLESRFAGQECDDGAVSSL